MLSSTTIFLVYCVCFHNARDKKAWSRAFIMMKSSCLCHIFSAPCTYSPPSPRGAPMKTLKSNWDKEGVIFCHLFSTFILRRPLLSLLLQSGALISAKQLPKCIFWLRQFFSLLLKGGDIAVANSLLLSNILVLKKNQENMKKAFTSSTAAADVEGWY